MLLAMITAESIDCARACLQCRLGDEKRCEAYEALITKSARPRACKVEITTQMKRAAGVPMRRTMICGVVTSRYSGKN
jgi:hypothetical protein